MDKQYQPTLTEVQDWVLKLYNTCEQTITKAERLEQHKYAVMVQRPQDKKFLVKMLDESSQIRDRKILAKRIKTLLDQYGVRISEQTGCFLIQNVSGIRTSFRLYRYPDYQKTPAHGYLASYYQ